jgi:transposase
MSAPALVAHLSTAELGQRYRAARQPIERSHLQIVWLLSQGRSEREVAAVTGYGQRWITAIVRRYNAEGAGGLGDQRARNTGARPLLRQEDEVALRAALAEPPADGGLWTGPKVAAWMTARLGRKIWPQRSSAARSTGLPAEARLPLAGAPPAARQGGERRGAGGVQKGLFSR